ncbi:glucose-6-phosphate isomerase [Knoellia sp. 3-2P3]|uniref:glucose-6-phosphate isomerase n=1 Tax=unclassified Knoellia TaxID=2618719 RepID=UPI0023DCDED2|nr:glucose-6-phosphate isomerase [Knoellia sp. 3-2P3]MDF2091906.1 glucose-6-phosphate isomerase [Knoellia sp. 3-2P3]
MSAVGVVASGPAADAIAARVPELVAERFASRLFAQDATLWGPEAQAEASVRLSWVGLPRSSRPLVGEVAALREHFRGEGVDRVVLCGMGGSSLAPEVICATAGVPLVVLDSSDPDMVRSALVDLERTVVVVSSKSGSTVETDSQRRAFQAAFTEAGIDPTARIVVVTDPGSPLDRESRDAGYRVVNADPNVGGRYSALTAFGLVPSGLAGADVEAILDDAEAVSDVLGADDEGNPALRLGAAMGGTSPLRDKLVLVDDGSGIVGLPDWAEQLIAESTGKRGTGILPVVVAEEEEYEVEWPPDDVTVLRLKGDAEDADSPDELVQPGRSDIEVTGSLGAQLLLWEAATAVAGRLLGINPFDQPDVESAKKAARGLLEDSGGQVQPPAFTDGAVEVRALGGDWLGDATTVEQAVDALLRRLRPDGYVAVMAYLDRLADASLADVRPRLAAHVRRPVTFGWGPRFLHSTGQFHKGGPDIGVYLQVTAEPREDLEVPGRDFTFGEFIAAQAAGDAQVLAEIGRPVLRLHLTDHDAGLRQVVAALTRHTLT